MSLVNVLSVELKPEKIPEYQLRVMELVQKSREIGDEFHWTAHESIYGEIDTIHFSSTVLNFEDMSKRGTVIDMLLRVYGEDKAVEALKGFGSCVRSERMTVSLDRLDLSYLPEEVGTTAQAASVVTVLRSRLGQQEACEELIRKTAEAIPKLGDEPPMVTFKVIAGDLSEYWMSRPVDDIGQLDQIRPDAQLLNEAFGNAEGGLIYRAGMQATESATRSIVRFKAELSNPRV